MAVAAISYIAVVVAAIAGWLFGSLWYGLLGSRWQAALGKTKAELMPAGRPPLGAMLWSAVALVVMAYVLAGSIAHLGPGNVTLRNGLISGAIIWVGFLATSLVTMHRYQRAAWSLTLIDAGHWLGVLLLQGAIIGAFGE
jgi:hypothetical protein